MSLVPLDPFSEVVDKDRRWSPEWYSWLSRFTTQAAFARTDAVMVADLPNPVTTGKGARSFVTDANATGFGSPVTGGGTFSVPVYCDGALWLIG